MQSAERCGSGTAGIGSSPITSLKAPSFWRSFIYAVGKSSRYHYFIFSLGGFTEPLLECGKRGEVTLLTLDELY
ncbi:MAG: hypothetical protein K6E36_07110 [Oscillospiraceae bacterium]|nr:hypothetical protein [Oscillospiraceae bacterium]